MFQYPGDIYASPLCVAFGNQEKWDHRDRVFVFEQRLITERETNEVKRTVIYSISVTLQ